MFDRNGQVIGVVVLKAGIEGVGFAIPATANTEFLLKATRRDGAKGQLIRKWLDSSLAPLKEDKLIDIKSGSASLSSSKDRGQATPYPFKSFSPGDAHFLELLSRDE